ncbi:MAG: DUF177 domain-containing protein [Candidatus Omnitrophica bacterium]|jgi:uncharacterized protein|nr:DUF177 domain-containing protein [Candidatus Omnitrophota bacterium]
MKVALKQIKENEALRIKEQIPASSWNMDSADISFLEEITLDCCFERVGGQIIVSAEIYTHKEITCSRCLDKVRLDDKYTFNKSYEISGLKDYLEIDEDIREEVLLNFPMKLLCKDNCKGICSRCGKNLNYEKCNCPADKKVK